MEQYKIDFVEFMVESGALKFGDFVTKSGRKTPYFVNTGLFNTGPQIKSLGEYYAKAIHSNHLRIDTIFGPAYKGIPLSVTTSIALSTLFNQTVGYSFNRKEAKDHGEGGTIIGRSLKDKQKMLIVDDVITAGTSIKESLEIFKNYPEIEIAGALISVDRNEKVDGDKSAREVLGALGVDVYSIVSIEEVVGYLYNNDINGKRYIDDEQLERIEGYRAEYGA
jgi:orotate phosphoribosyltransferase